MRLPTIGGLRLSVLFALYSERLRQRAGSELLAAAGIAVGVALVFGVLVASTSVTSSASETIHSVTGAARLQLAARSPDGFDEHLAALVAKLQGVKRSGAILRQNVMIVGPSGRDSAQLIGVTATVSTLGGLVTGALTDGSLPESGGLLLPGDIASAAGAKQGTTITVLAAGSAHRIKVADVLAGSKFGSIVLGPVAIAQMPIAQELTGRVGRVTQILVQPRDGADRMVARELEKLAIGRLDTLPADREIALVDEAFKPSQQSTDLFALISAMVGFLLAFNAMLLTVPERRRFVAQLAILGYSSVQLAVILIFQALALGVVSAIVGIGLGYVLSHTLFDEVPTYLAFAFPIGSHKSVSLTILSGAFACGIAASVLASLPPILELWRKRTLDAVLRERGQQGQSIPSWTIAVLAIVALALTSTVTLLVLAAASATLVGGVVLAAAVVLAVPACYRLVIGLLSPISERRKGMFALAVIELESTATRSIALACVAGLVVYVGIAIGGARRDVTVGLETTIAQYESTADIWITTGNNVFDTDSFRAPNLPSMIARLPTVASVRIYQGGLLDDADRRLLIRAHDSHLQTMIQSLAIVHGNLARANQLLHHGGWATVSEGFAGEHHLGINDPFLLPTPSGLLRLRVAATTTNLGWPPGLITLSSTDFQRAWLTSQPTALEVNLRQGVNPIVGRRKVQNALVAYPGLQARTAAEATAEADSNVRQGLSSLEQISTLVLVIGALAIAASLSAAIWQRRVALASMRVWGYDRLQLWRSVLLENTILLAIGCGIGSIFGLYGHALATRYLRVTTGFPAPFAVGTPQIVVTVVLVTGISLLIIALPGAGAVRVSPTTAFQD